MVEDRKEEYKKCYRQMKKKVEFDIFCKWRARDLLGRFLKEREGNEHVWCDVGDGGAKRKTAQALREKKPVSLQKQEGTRNMESFSAEHDSEEDEDGSSEGRESVDAYAIQRIAQTTWPVTLRSIFKQELNRAVLTWVFGVRK